MYSTAPQAGSVRRRGNPRESLDHRPAHKSNLPVVSLGGIQMKDTKDPALGEAAQYAEPAQCLVTCLKLSVLYFLQIADVISSPYE